MNNLRGDVSDFAGCTSSCGCVEYRWIGTLSGLTTSLVQMRTIFCSNRRISLVILLF